MRARIITTITTDIDLDTFKPEHSVEVESEETLPQQVVLSAALGGLKSAQKALEKKGGFKEEEEDA